MESQRFGCLAAILFALSFSAYAHDSTESDAAWYNSLKVPGTSYTCCGLHHDCEPTQAHLTNDGWEAVWHNKTTERDQWVKVPADHVNHQANPTGYPILCINPWGTVLCFVPVSEG